MEESLRFKSYYLAFLALLFLLGFLAGIVLSDYNLFYIVITIMGFFVSFVLKDKALFRIYVLVYCLSTFYVVFYYQMAVYDFGLPYYMGGSDDIAYENQAAQLINVKDWWFYNSAMIGNVLGIPWHNSTGYVYFLAVLTYIGEHVFNGYSTFIPRQLNSIALSFVCVFIYQIFQKYSSNKEKLSFACVMFGAFPLVQYISAHVFRDVIILLMIVYVVYILDAQRSRLTKVLVVTGLLYVISQFRVYYVPVVVLIVIAFIVSRSRFYERNNVKVAVFSLSLIAVLAMSFSDLSHVEKLLTSVNNYGELVQEKADGMSSVIFNSSPVLQPFLRLLYSFLYPVPQLSPENSFSSFFYKIGTFFQIVVFVYAARGFFIMLKVGKSHYIILSGLMFYFAFIFGTFTFRHQIYFMPFLFGLMGVALSRDSINNQVLGFLAAFLSLFYFSLIYFLRYF